MNLATLLSSARRCLLSGLALMLGLAPAALAQSSLVITGVIDGPLTGGVPKAVEVYVLNDVADLSAYGLAIASNGGGSDGAPEFTFPAVAASAGDYLYVASEQSQFNAFFGFDPDYTGAISINGDDAIELYQNGVVVDVFGDVDTDATGEPWEYTDGWAYRADGTGPDGTTFELANWTFSGPDALDDEATNAEAATPFPVGTYTPGASGTPPIVAFGEEFETVLEGDTAEVAVILDYPDDSPAGTPVTVAVHFVAAESTADAADFTFSPATVTFSGTEDGEQQVVTIITNADGEQEGEEVASFVLEVTSGEATIGEFGAYILTIEDADTAPGAQVQLIHNAADPLLGTASVRIEDSGGAVLFDEEISFRGATQLLEMPAGEALTATLTFEAGGGFSVTETFTLEEGLFVAIATGTVDLANPPASDFQIELVRVDDELRGGLPVDLVLNHGAPDAPALDVVVAETQEVLVDGLAYQQTVDLDVAPALYTLEFRDDATGEVLTAVAVNLLDDDGDVFTILASGFFDPPAGGAEFALLGVNQNGIVEQLEGGDRFFTAVLGGGHETAPVATPAGGTVAVTLTGDQIVVTGSFEGLAGDYTASHIHLGYFGENGGIEIPLNPTLGGDNRSGVFEAASNTFTLTAEQAEALAARRLYVNVHSQVYPPGEIRGQLLPAADAHYASRLAGGAEVPHTITGATGGVVLEVHGTELIVTGSFEGLIGDYTASHIHLGRAGENGGIEIPLNPTLGGDNRSGVFEAASNTFTLTAEQAEALAARRLYVNVHSQVYPPGEIRGQLLPVSEVYLQGQLLAANEVPGALSTGIGGVAVELRGDELVLTGTFRGLTSAYTASHIHLAPAGESGGIEIPLDPVITDDDGVFEAASHTFTLTPEQIEALLAEELYVNVHSVENPAGELRAQLLLAPNNAPDSTAITAPPDGTTITIEGDPNQELAVSWEERTDPNDDRVVYVVQISPFEDFSLVAFQFGAGTETSFSLDYGSIDELLAGLGIPVGGSVSVFHRVLASDGSVYAPSEPFSITITRGAIVNTEEDPALPTVFALDGNYPNPFATTTTLRYDLPADAAVSLELYDLLGRQVLRTAPQPTAAGAGRTLEVEAGLLPAGTYVYRLTAETAAERVTASGRMTVLR